MGVDEYTVINQFLRKVLISENIVKRFDYVKPLELLETIITIQSAAKYIIKI